MADFTEAAAAQNALISREGGLVQELEYRNVRYHRGTPLEQVKAAMLLAGQAARQSGGGIFRLAKFQRASE